MNKFLRWMAPLVLGVISLSATVLAQTAGLTDGAYTSSNLGIFPPNVGYGAGGPMLMLTASKDHTLFSPIYTDYEDVDGDGTVDYTFKPTFKYYGYFDSSKCYGYNAQATYARFEPAVAVSNLSTYACPTDNGQRLWSGNFLNWATMTRIDVVRKMLYGGFRREDTTTDTTLEMAQVSQDAHSFVKYYAGDDLRSYTPFDPVDDLASGGLTICNRASINVDPTSTNPGVPQMRIAKGNYSMWATIPTKVVCRWANEGGNFSFGAKATAFYTKYGPNQGVLAVDPKAHKVSLPSSTADAAAYSVGNVNVGAELAVRVRVCVPGQIGQERCQAYGSGSSTVYKPVGLLQQFGTTTDLSNAPRAEFGLLTGSYDSNLRGGALRKNVGSLNDEVDPTTGRFCSRITENAPTTCNTTAGIVKSFDSIRLYDVGNYNNNSGSSNGFVLPQDIRNGNFPSWGNPISEMLVQTMSYMAGQSATQPSNMARDTAVGMPSNVAWADPLNDATVDRASGRTRKSLYGKSICRAMDVLAISSGTASFDTKDGASEDIYSIFSEQFTGLNGGSNQTLTLLTDVVGVNEGINGTSRSVGSVSAAVGTDCTSKPIGLLSDVAGVCPEAPGVKGSYLGAGAAFFANTRAIRELGGASQSGQTIASSLGANTGATVAQSNLPAYALRLKTYAASLAGGVIRIEIPVPGTTRKVYITPESSWSHASLRSLMPGAVLTFRSLYASATSGAYVVTWNDAQFGGDYDMDLVGFIRWTLTPAASGGGYDLAVYTDVLNHDAGAQGSHGFSITGTDVPPSNVYQGDGRYLTHGSNGYSTDGSCATLASTTTGNAQAFALKCGFQNSGMSKQSPFTKDTPRTATAPAQIFGDGYAWPTSIDGAANTVSFYESTPERTTTTRSLFRVSTGAAAEPLRDPLWYMAKYGSFDTGETQFSKKSDALPAASAGSAPVNWDKEKNNGAACTSNCADGEPDGYFLARRPDLLEERLRTLLEKIVLSSNSAPAVSSSQLVDGSLKYVAEFNKDANSGTINAYPLLNTGVFDTEPIWSAGSKLTSAASRQVLTNRVDRSTVGGLTQVSQVGMPFTYSADAIESDAATAYRTALAGGTSTDALTRAQLLVDYMRGVRTSGERTLFRSRDATNIMGMVVNSSPWLQSSKSSARFSDGDFGADAPSYRSFVVGKTSKDSLLWVGANDGMLHAFKSLDGTPVMSFVPSPLVSRLSSALDASNTSAVSLMDGSPYVGDVLVAAGTTSASWRSYLFSSLGRGGRGVFALDVSTPSALTEANAGSVFKWMFTGSDDPDLGYNLTDPVRHNVSGQATPIVRLNNGKFGLLVPNGYKSANGLAAMFVLFVDGPDATGWQATGTAQSYVKLLTNATDAGNGMMGVTWVDLNNDGIADVLYGTDLKGQVWKFDIRSADTAQWQSAFISSTVPVPFFTAKDANNVALPITTAPVTSFPKFGGVMLSFATGQSIETGDFPNSGKTQRFFSVWDRGGYAEDQIYPFVATTGQTNPKPLPGTGTRPINSDAFLKLALRRNDAGQVYRVTIKSDGTEVPVPAAAMVSFDAATQDGWLFDFPSSGEAVISSPVGLQGFVFFTSVRPQTNEDSTCTVSPLATGYAFNPVSALPVSGLLPAMTLLNADGTSTSYDLFGSNLSDQRVIVARDATSSSKGTGGCGAGKVKVRFLGQKSDEQGCASVSTLRIQWREIPGMKTTP